MVVSSNKTEWEWRGRLVHIAVAAASWESGEDSERLKTVDELVVLVGDADPIVGFAAKEALVKLLCDKSIRSHSTCIVRRILGEEGNAHGFRFALLRQLINDSSRNEIPREESSDAGTENGGDEAESSSEEDIEDDHIELSNVYLDAVLQELVLVETGIACAFDGIPSSSAEPRQYEALVFLGDLLRQVRLCYASAAGSAAARFVPSLCGMVRRFVETVVVPLNYEDAPSSVCCAALNVVGAWHELILAARSTDENGKCNCYRECISCSIQWFVSSSCAPVALRMINASKAEAETASENAFIARQNQYPFLQKWLQVLGRLATSVVDALDEWEGGSNLPAAQIHRWLRSLGSDAENPLELPSRQRILAILSEQDDVMVQVLNSITYTIVKMKQRAGWNDKDRSAVTGCSDEAGLVDKMLAEFDPDLLFSDLLSAFAFDHLVLLDFLTSSETAMLEYLLRYLRHLAGRWSTSRRILTEFGRLDQVMSTLIRLRLEIERLVAADLFPYDPAPLIRRLEAVEDAYEAKGLTS